MAETEIKTINGKELCDNKARSDISELNSVVDVLNDAKLTPESKPDTGTFQTVYKDSSGKLWTAQASGSGTGGVTIPNTTSLLKGNNAGGVVAATAGTDYATLDQVNVKYSKPSDGIPKTDLESAVRTSLGKADDAQPKALQDSANKTLFGSTATIESALTDLGNAKLNPSSTSDTSGLQEVYKDTSGKLWTSPGSGGSGGSGTGGVSIPNTTNLLKGNGAGGVVAATSGTDYATPAQVNAKYSKPSSGIPKTDLTSSVQTSLGKADDAQPKTIQDANNHFTATTVEGALDELYEMIQDSGGTGTEGGIATENATEVPVASAVEEDNEGLVTSALVYAAITSAIGNIGALIGSGSIT